MRRGRGGPEWLVVGVLGRAVGTRGELEVVVYSDDPRRFAPGSAMAARRASELRPLTVRRLRSHRHRRLVSFEEVGDRNAAEALRGAELVVPRQALRALGPGEYWDFELVGCRVVRADGSEAGVVTAVEHLPAQDVLVVKTARGERLIPLVGALVRSVDAEAGVVVVDPIPGLLDDAEPPPP